MMKTLLPIVLQFLSRLISFDFSHLYKDLGLVYSKHLNLFFWGLSYWIFQLCLVFLFFLPFQAFSHVIHHHHPPVQSSQFLYEQTCRRESKGTGVFIPQSSQPRRKQRQGRFGSSCYAKSHRTENTKIVSQQVASNNGSNFKPKYSRG